jgi:hypothetical protein
MHFFSSFNHQLQLITQLTNNRPSWVRLDAAGLRGVFLGAFPSLFIAYSFGLSSMEGVLWSSPSETLSTSGAMVRMVSVVGLGVLGGLSAASTGVLGWYLAWPLMRMIGWQLEPPLSRCVAEGSKALVVYHKRDIVIPLLASAKWAVPEDRTEEVTNVSTSMPGARGAEDDDGENNEAQARGHPGQIAHMFPLRMDPNFPRIAARITSLL